MLGNELSDFYVNPQDCISSKIECHCLTTSDLELLAHGLNELDHCKIKLSMSDDWIERHKRDASQKQPVFSTKNILTAVISLVLGMFLGSQL